MPSLYSVVQLLEAVLNLLPIGDCAWEANKMLVILQCTCTHCRYSFINLCYYIVGPILPFVMTTSKWYFKKSLLSAGIKTYSSWSSFPSYCIKVPIQISGINPKYHRFICILVEKLIGLICDSMSCCGI